MDRRRWRALVTAVAVTVMGALCGVTCQGSAVADSRSGYNYSWWTNGSPYPGRGESHSDGSTWRDGWCRRGERGYAVVVDYSGVPEMLRGVLTDAHTKWFGPTAADGWIVRCHEGLPAGERRIVSWTDAIRDVGLSTNMNGEGYELPYNATPLSSGSSLILNVDSVWYPSAPPQPLESKTFKNLYTFTEGVWIRPDADGRLSGFPAQGTSLDGSWPGKIPYAKFHLDHPYEWIDASKMTPGSIMYVSYGGAACRGDVTAYAPSKQVCLGEAALHPKPHEDPKTHQPCPGWTLTPQYSDGTVNGCIPKNPRPQPSVPSRGPTTGPTRNPGSGNGPHPHRPRHTHKPTPSPKSHPALRHDGSNGRGGSTGAGHGAVRRGEAHAAGRVSSQVRKAARTPSPSASSSASPSATPSPSVSPSTSSSVTPSPSTSPSVSAGVVVSPSPGDGRVWGSEQQGPSASDGARRRVPGWVWGAGAGVLVVAGVVAWWMTRGRRRDREDDEVGTDLFE